MFPLYSMQFQQNFTRKETQSTMHGTRASAIARKTASSWQKQLCDLVSPLSTPTHYWLHSYSVASLSKAMCDVQHIYRYIAFLLSGQRFLEFFYNLNMLLMWLASLLVLVAIPLLCALRISVTAVHQNIPRFCGSQTWVKFVYNLCEQSCF